jgi:hypothetical protein
MPLPIAAFDPGITGALALLGDPDFDEIQLFDLPQANNELDPAALARILKDAAPVRAVIELVHSMPKQGVASTFKFGRSYGTILGVIGALAIPLTRVRPQVWKKHFGLLNQPKDASRALALRLYPNLLGLHLKKHHGRADALLLARFLLESNPRST